MTTDIQQTQQQTDSQCNTTDDKHNKHRCTGIKWKTPEHGTRIENDAQTIGVHI